MSTDQAAKFVHQLIPLTNAFLNRIIEYKEKIHASYTTKKVASVLGIEQLTRRSKSTFKTLIL